MTKNKISVPRAIMLAMSLAAAGQDPGVAPVSVQSHAEQTPAQETGTTQAPPSATMNAAQVAELEGGGKGRRRGQAYNPLRRMRHRLEALGIITSGRQWRNFRKYARHNPVVAEFWARTLAGQV